MKSGPLYAFTGSALAAAWSAVYFHAQLTPEMRSVVALLPYLALIWFGCYGLGTISYSLICFRECPEAATE